MPGVDFDDRYNAAEDLLGRNLEPGRRERTAYVDSDGAWSYAQLAERAGRFAALLATHDVRREQRIALVMTDTVQLAACLLGAMQRGVVPIPLNTRLKPKDYRYVLADSRAAALVCSAPFASTFEGVRAEVPSLAHVWVSDRDGGADRLEARLAQLEPESGFADTRAGEMAFWLYTSGTTGEPKGAVHAHAHPIATSKLYADSILQLGPDDVLFSAAKLFFAYGLGNGLTFPLAAGAKTILLEGSPTAEAVAEIFLSNRADEVRPGSTGRPVEGYRVRLVDDDDHELAGADTGHLEVCGPTTALMYWNQRERSKQTFRGQWMRTGDKYRRDADGYYHYEGRSDDLIKVGGIWVSPFEVESALLEHPDVLECAVVGQPDHDALIKPHAFVVCVEGTSPSDALATALTEFVRDRLAPYKRPRWVEFVDALPKTATGKIQRLHLRRARRCEEEGGPGARSRGAPPEGPGV